MFLPLNHFKVCVYGNKKNIHKSQDNPKIKIFNLLKNWVFCRLNIKMCQLNLNSLIKRHNCWYENIYTSQILTLKWKGETWWFSFIIIIHINIKWCGDVFSNSSTCLIIFHSLTSQYQVSIIFRKRCRKWGLYFVATI